MNELTLNDVKATSSAPTKTKRLKPKQRQTIYYWTTPTSETYGNLYKSAVLAGFRPSYALNITHLRPSWLSETMESLQLEEEHIRQGIQHIATKPVIESRSPDDTRLNAYELLGEITGMIGKNKGTTTNILVQPILGGVSAQTDKKPTHTVDIDTKETP
jgi:hypothetical protein